MKAKRFWTIIIPLLAFAAVHQLSVLVDGELNISKIPFNLNFIGFIFVASGIAIVLYVFYLFDEIGNGTPMPKQILPGFTTKKLVIVGPYRYTRNPMVIGYSLILFGTAFVRSSYLMLVISSAIAVLFHLFIVCVEEKDMEKRFGKEYLEYKKRVPRWVPKFYS